MDRTVLCWPPQCAMMEPIDTFVSWLIDWVLGDFLFAYLKEDQTRENFTDRIQNLITSSRQSPGTRLALPMSWRATESGSSTASSTARMVGLLYWSDFL
ncbi:MAG: hypothetical protein ACOWWM_15395 [Desulfobacterales bacterium]